MSDLVNDDVADSAEPDAAKPEAMLTAIEARILGALMEKQLTTPDAYPLTLNSLVLACNQKTSREPVTNLSEGEVKRCLYQLQDRKLVVFDYGSRAEKFSQNLTKTLHFDKAEHSLFCIMLLRGPQTLSELLTRTRRMYDFSGLNEVTELLEKLLNRITPQIVKLPHLPGQREDRYMHLLCGKPDLTMAVKSTTVAAASADLAARVDELERQVAWLMEQLGETDRH